MMEAGVLFLLLLAGVGIASAQDFYGDSISFNPSKLRGDGTFEVVFYHRLNGKSDCPVPSDFICEDGVCSSFVQSDVTTTDQGNMGQGVWCQSEGRSSAILHADTKTFSTSGSGCCWPSNVNGKTDFASQAEINMGVRSDSHTFNNCPIITTVASLRVPQNCFTEIHLLTYDPEEDSVRCSFASDPSSPPSLFSLDQVSCSLTANGEIPIGVHVIEILLEDLPKNTIILTYRDGTTQTVDPTSAPQLCKVKLQFTVEILAPVPSCEEAHVQPVFVSNTPLHGEVFYAPVGHTFEVTLRAQAEKVSITDFQVSGPAGMTKTFTDERFGKATVDLSWTPQDSDLGRKVPVCLTAETSETQSKMRCFIIIVIHSSIAVGKATVKCSASNMIVAVEKASVPNIDVSFLKLMDDSCSLQTNETHIFGVVPFSECGTMLEDGGENIIFSNEINSFEDTDSIITRRQAIKIGFFCQFPKTINISNSYNSDQSNFIFTETSLGSFDLKFKIYNDSTFTNVMDQYPIRAVIFDKMYMGIEAESEFNNVKIFVESCKATPDGNPDNPVVYEIIKNGCNMDNTLETSYDKTTFYFDILAFKFNGDFDLVYITCSVIMCDSTSPFSRCAQGCLRDPVRRRKRDLAMETPSQTIQQGPIQILDYDNPIATGDDIIKNSAVMKLKNPVVTVSPPPGSPEVTMGHQKLDIDSWKVPPSEFGEGGSDVSQENTRRNPKLIQTDHKFMTILSANISTVVFASCFLMSLVVLAVVLYFFLRKKRAEDRRSLIESDWEN